MDSSIPQLLQSVGLSCDELISKLVHYKSSLSNEQTNQTQSPHNLKDNDGAKTEIQNCLKDIDGAKTEIQKCSQVKPDSLFNDEFAQKEKQAAVLPSNELYHKIEELKINTSNINPKRQNSILQISEKLRCSDEPTFNKLKNVDSNSSKSVDISQSFNSEEKKKCETDLSLKKYLKIKPIEQLCNVKPFESNDNRGLNTDNRIRYHMEKETSSSNTKNINRIYLANEGTETKEKSLLDITRLQIKTHHLPKDTEIIADTHSSIKDHDYSQSSCSKPTSNSDEDSLSSNNHCDIELADISTIFSNSTDNLRETIRQQLLSLRNMKKSGDYLAEIRNKKSLFAENIKKKCKSVEITSDLPHALQGKDSVSDRVYSELALESNPLVDKECSGVNIVSQIHDRSKKRCSSENINVTFSSHHKKIFEQDKPNFLQINKNISERFDNDPGVRKTVKNTEKSPFISNSLDNFLNESAELQISYSIPKLGAEEGIKIKKSVGSVDTVQKPNKRSRYDFKNDKNEKKMAKEKKLFKAKTVGDMRRQMHKLSEQSKSRKKKFFELSKIEDTKSPIIENAISARPKIRRSNYILHNKKKLWVVSSSENLCLGTINDTTKFAFTNKRFSTNEKALSFVNEENYERSGVNKRPSILKNTSVPLFKSRIKYKAGPLSKKPELQNFNSNENWKTEIKKMPTVYLELRPELNKSIDPNIFHLIPILGDTKISSDRAEFALSTLCVKKQPVAPPKVFKCNLEYMNNQCHVIVRKPIESENTEKLEKINETLDSSDIISKILDNIVSYAETKLIENSVIQDDDYDFSQSEKDKSPKRPKVRRNRVELELRRLNCKVIDVATNDNQENMECSKSYCKFGCVCKSLKCQSTFSDHCQLVECMFECKCRSETDDPATSNDTLSSQVISNLDDRAKRNLAKVEREFTQTLIHTDGDVILVGTGGRDKRRRESKMPLKFTDYISNQDESNSSPILPDKYHLNVKLCSVPLEQMNLCEIVPYCLVHRKHDCVCSGQSLEIRRKDELITSPPYARSLKYKRKEKKLQDILTNNSGTQIHREKDGHVDILNMNEGHNTQFSCKKSESLSFLRKQRNITIDINDCERVRPVNNIYKMRNKTLKYKKKLRETIRKDQDDESSNEYDAVSDHINESKQNRRKQSFKVRDDCAPDTVEAKTSIVRKVANLKPMTVELVKQKSLPVLEGEIKINLEDNRNLFSLPYFNAAHSDTVLSIISWSSFINNFRNGKFNVWTRDKPEAYNKPREILFNFAGKPLPKGFVDIRDSRYKSGYIKRILNGLVPQSSSGHPMMNLLIEKKGDNFTIIGHCIKKQSIENDVSVEIISSNTIPSTSSQQDHIDRIVTPLSGNLNSNQVQIDLNSTAISKKERCNVDVTKKIKNNRISSGISLLKTKYNFSPRLHINDDTTAYPIKALKRQNSIKKNSQNERLYPISSNSSFTSEVEVHPPNNDENCLSSFTTNMKDSEICLNKISASSGVSIPLAAQLQVENAKDDSGKFSCDQNVYKFLSKKEQDHISTNARILLSNTSRLSNVKTNLSICPKQLQQQRLSNISKHREGSFFSVQTESPSVKGRLISLLKKNRINPESVKQRVSNEMPSSEIVISNETSLLKQQQNECFVNRTNNLKLETQHLNINISGVVLNENEKCGEIDKESILPLDANIENDVLLTRHSQVQDLPNIIGTSTNTTESDVIDKCDILSLEVSDSLDSPSSCKSSLFMPGSSDEENSISNNESLLSLLNERVSDNDIKMFTINASTSLERTNTVNNTTSEQLNLENVSNESSSLIFSPEKSTLLLKKENNFNNRTIAPDSESASKENITGIKNTASLQEENQGTRFFYNMCFANLSPQKNTCNKKRNPIKKVQRNNVDNRKTSSNNTLCKRIEETKDLVDTENVSSVDNIRRQSDSCLGSVSKSANAIRDILTPVELSLSEQLQNNVNLEKLNSTTLNNNESLLMEKDEISNKMSSLVCSSEEKPLLNDKESLLTLLNKKEFGDDTKLIANDCSTLPDVTMTSNSFLLVESQGECLKKSLKAINEETSVMEKIRKTNELDSSLLCSVEQKSLSSEEEDLLALLNKQDFRADSKLIGNNISTSSDSTTKGNSLLSKEPEDERLLNNEESSLMKKGKTSDKIVSSLLYSVEKEFLSDSNTSNLVSNNMLTSDATLTSGIVLPDLARDNSKAVSLSTFSTEKQSLNNRKENSSPLKKNYSDEKASFDIDPASVIFQTKKTQPDNASVGIIARSTSSELIVKQPLLNQKSCVNSYVENLNSKEMSLQSEKFVKDSKSRLKEVKEKSVSFKSGNNDKKDNNIFKASANETILQNEIEEDKSNCVSCPSSVRQMETHSSEMALSADTTTINSLLEPTPTKSSSSESKITSNLPIKNKEMPKLKRITILNNTLLVPSSEDCVAPGTIKSSVAKCISDSSKQVTLENSETNVKAAKIIKCTHKDMYGMTHTLTLTIKKFDKRVFYTFENEKENEILLPLPKVSKKIRWRMIYLKSDFSYLLFLISKYAIKYTDLMDVVKLAKQVERTVVLRNNKFLREYKQSNFAIYCVPNYSDRLFIGPFEHNEKHNTETLRYKNGRLMSTSAFARLSGTAPENIPKWVLEESSNAMIDITKDDEEDISETSELAQEYMVEQSSLFCQPFVEKLTKLELTRKRVNRYIITNIPHLGYFEAFQTNGKMIEVYWPQATKGFRFPSLPFAKYALILYLTKMLYLIPPNYKIDVIVMTTLNTVSNYEVLPEYLRTPKSYVCGDFGIHSIDAIPESILAINNISSKEELLKQDENTDKIDDQIIQLFGLFLMTNEQRRKYTEPSDILKWAKNQIEEAIRMDQKYARRKQYLQKVLLARRKRVTSSSLIMPVELERSLQASTHASDTIEILDSDDDGDNSNVTVDKEASHVSNPSTTDNAIVLKDRSDENESS